MENARTPARPTDRPMAGKAAAPDGADCSGGAARTYGAVWTGAPEVFGLLVEALEAWADQFDGSQDEDVYVSGTDLLEWFGDWRLRVRAALTSAVADPIWEQARVALAAAKPPGGERLP